MCQTLGQGLAPSEQNRQRSLCSIGEDRQSRQIRHREKYMWYQMKKRAIEKDKARKGERVCGWMGAVVENFKEKVTAEQLSPTHLSGPPWTPGLREQSLFQSHITFTSLALTLITATATAWKCLPCQAELPQTWGPVISFTTLFLEPKTGTCMWETLYEYLLGEQMSENRTLLRKCPDFPSAGAHRSQYIPLHSF